MLFVAGCPVVVVEVLAETTDGLTDQFDVLVNKCVHVNSWARAVRSPNRLSNGTRRH